MAIASDLFRTVTVKIHDISQQLPYIVVNQADDDGKIIRFVPLDHGQIVTGFTGARLYYPPRSDSEFGDYVTGVESDGAWDFTIPVGVLSVGRVGCNLSFIDGDGETYSRNVVFLVEPAVSGVFDPGDGQQTRLDKVIGTVQTAADTAIGIINETADSAVERINKTASDAVESIGKAEESISESVTEARESAEATANSANQAATSASAAQTSEHNASNSATQASQSATAAKQSETNAAASERNAAESASNAASSAGEARVSAETANDAGGPRGRCGGGCGRARLLRIPVPARRRVLRDRIPGLPRIQREHGRVHQSRDGGIAHVRHLYGQAAGHRPFVDETTGRLPDQYLPQGVIDLQGDLEQAVTNASASATAAAQSASQAQANATAANSSSQSAAASAESAQTATESAASSKDAAARSASEASESAQAAEASKTNAAASASAAKVSETNAAASATAAREAVDGFGAEGEPTVLENVTLPELPAPTFNVYTTGGYIPPTVDVDYERDVNLVLDALEAKIAALQVADKTN